MGIKWNDSTPIRSERNFYQNCDGEHEIMSADFTTREAATVAAAEYNLAISWANGIIQGTRNYADSPTTLRTKINEMLRIVGRGDLIP